MENPWQVWAFYRSRDWRFAEAAYLRGHPWCDVCALVPIKEGSVAVNHIVPIAEGGVILDERNYEALCRDHYNKRKPQQREAFERRRAR